MDVQQILLQIKQLAPDVYAEVLPLLHNPVHKEAYIALLDSYLKDLIKQQTSYQEETKKIYDTYTAEVQTLSREVLTAFKAEESQIQSTETNTAENLLHTL